MQAPRTRSAGRGLLPLFLGLVALATPSLASAGGNLLKNPGFERGGKEVDAWAQTVPIAVATAKPSFTVSEVEPVEGKRCASVRVDYRGGLTAYAQVLRVPARAKSIHFEAQARLDRNVHEGGAMLKVSFVGPDLPGGRVETESRLLSGVATWTLLSIDASIPEGTKSIEVRCGVVGPGVASFDEALVTASTEASFESVFGTVTSDYAVRLPANASAQMLEPFVRVPLPLAAESQRPIAFRINSRPEGRIATFGVVGKGENRMLEIHFLRMFPGDEIKLRLDVLVMIDAVEPDLSGTVRLPRPAQIHDEEAVYLTRAPGIDPANVDIVKALGEIKGNDLADVLEKMHGWTASKLELRGPISGDSGSLPEPDESVEACLATGEAGSLGFANTLASMLRGHGLPARLMIGTSSNGQVDEHDYVDVWTPSTGWTRIDPLTGRWPIAATEAVIHRQIMPLDGRPEGAPSHDPVANSPGLILESRPDRMGRSRVYQPAVPVTLQELGLTTMKAQLEAAYTDLIGDPESGDQWLPIQGLDATLPEIPGASRAHQEIQRWLDSPRLVGQ